MVKIKLPIKTMIDEEKILIECKNGIENTDIDTQTSNSISDCHNYGVFSIWITDTIRSFVTEESIKSWEVFDNNHPHKNNEYFLIHDHRYDLTSIPLFGEQDNIIYKKVEYTKEENGYEHYLFHSALFEEDKKPKIVFQKKVGLERISFTKNEPWFLEKDQIHRAVWKGPIVALIKEHRDPKSINKQSTNGFLTLSAKGIFPPTEGLYKPMKKEKCIQLRDKVYKLVLNRLKYLKK